MKKKSCWKPLDILDYFRNAIMSRCKSLVKNAKSVQFCNNGNIMDISGEKTQNLVSSAPTNLLWKHSLTTLCHFYNSKLWIESGFLGLFFCRKVSLNINMFINKNHKNFGGQQHHTHTHTPWFAKLPPIYQLGSLHFWKFLYSIILEN